MVPGAGTWSFTGKQIAFYIYFILKYITQTWRRKRASTGDWEMAEEIEGCLDGDRGFRKQVQDLGLHGALESLSGCGLHEDFELVGALSL